MKIHEHEREVIDRMIYHRGYAVRLEQLLIEPDHPRGILVHIFDLDRIDDFRDAIDRGYLNVAASYGDLYRLVPQAIAGEVKPHYAQYRTRMEEVNGYVLEMQTELSGPGSPWGEGIRPHDLRRMDAARAALEAGDLQTAAQYGKLYRLDPVAVEPAVKPWRPSERAAERKAKLEAEQPAAEAQPAT